MGLSQYEIVLVNLDPTIGSEIQKTRPCIVISPSELNNYLHTVVIAPMTTSRKAYPTRVCVNFRGKDGRIALDQIRTVDARRVSKRLGTLREGEVIEVKKIIKETFVD